jgi:hypothetical protein
VTAKSGFRGPVRPVGSPAGGEGIVVVDRAEPWRPRWWLFWNFGGIVVVHLVANGGWTSTTAVVAPLALALTFVFVFVRRLPRWLTGGAGSERGGRGFLRVAGGVGWLLVAALVVAALVIHPPHGGDVVNAGVFVALFLGASVFVLSRLRPKRPEPRRAALRWRWRAVTAAVWVVAVGAVGAEVAAIVGTGGWLPWVLPIPAVVAVLALVVRRWDLAGAARCLASGDWTPVAAAAFDVRAGEPVNGWAVLPGDVRIRFHLPAVPADVAAELTGRRRLWLAGWPAEDFVVGLPDGGSYAVGRIGAHVRSKNLDRKNTVTGHAGRG